MVRPRRAEQCLPQEDATLKRNAAPQQCGRGIPAAARSLLRRDPRATLLGAPLRQEPDKADRLQSPVPSELLLKSGAHGVALLGIVVPATTSVARLMIIPILTATRSAEIYSAVPCQSSFF